MVQTLKVLAALIFVGVLGWVLLQPVFDAVDIDAVEPDNEQTATPLESREASPSEEPSPQPTESDDAPEPLPEEFRTERLLRPFPASCSRPPITDHDVLAVDRGTRIAIGTLAGPLEEVPAKALAGISVDGRLAWEKGDGAVAFAEPDTETVTTVDRGRGVVWSPVSSCGVVMGDEDTGLLVIPSGEPLVQADIRDAAFSPDGRKLAVVVDGPRATSVWVASVSGLTLREVFRERPGFAVRLKGWSPDGETLYITWPDGGLSFVTASDPPMSGGLSVRPVAELEHCGDRLLGIVGGRVAEITTRGPDYMTSGQEAYRYMSCAPAGNFIAAIGNQGLVLLDGNGNFLRDLTQDSGFTDVFVDWGTQGSGVLLGRVRSAGSRVAAELWHIPEGGTPAPTGIAYRVSPYAVEWSGSLPTGLP